jgi:hypothetical protein
MKPRRMRWVAQVACLAEERKVYKVLVRNPEGKRPLERPRRRWKDPGSRYKLVAGSCEHNDESSGSGAKELVRFNLYQLLPHNAMFSTESPIYMLEKLIVLIILQSLSQMTGYVCIPDYF